jgi:hypothetical protein
VHQRVGKLRHVRLIYARLLVKKGDRQVLQLLSMLLVRNAQVSDFQTLQQ